VLAMGAFSNTPQCSSSRLWISSADNPNRGGASGSWLWSPNIRRSPASGTEHGRDVDASLNRRDTHCHLQAYHKEKAMPAVEVSSATIAVEHVRIPCRRAFNEVRTAFEAGLPKLNEHIQVLLSNGDRERIKEIEDHGPKLFMFLLRDHG